VQLSSLLVSKPTPKWQYTCGFGIMITGSDRLKCCNFSSNVQMVRLCPGIQQPLVLEVWENGPAQYSTTAMAKTESIAASSSK